MDNSDGLKQNRTAYSRRILIIAGYAGSLIRFRGGLIAALQENGLRVVVACPGLNENAHVMNELQRRNVEAHDIPLSRSSLNFVDDLISLGAMHSLIRQVRPDTVLAYTIKPVVYGLLASYLCRVPGRYALITGLGYAFGEGRGVKHSLVNMVARQLYHVATTMATLVFFQNRDDEELFRKLGIMSESVTSVVVNGSGVDLERFSETPIPAGEPTFLLAARLIREKGVGEYVAAARRVKRRYPDAKFLIAGELDSNPDSITEKELNDWIAEGIVEYLGFIEDIRGAIARASVYVLPSYYREGIPMSILEAMAMGRPVITTEAPGCRETVVHGVNGYLVPKRSVEAIESAMLRFIDFPEQIPVMGSRSRCMAEERFDVNKVNAVIMRKMGCPCCPLDHDPKGC